MHHIDIAKKEGAKVEFGGNKLNSQGYFMENTILTNLHDDMKCIKEEVFGPVMCILKFNNLDEVIDRANNTNYGLSSSIMTSSLNTAIKASNSIRSGEVLVNSVLYYDVCTPFGGFKESGHGRENGEACLKSFTETKTVTIKRPDDCIP